MVFPGKLLWSRVHRRQWENGLFIAVVLLFTASMAANVGPLFWNGEITALGAVCSWLYLAAWSLAAAVLRNRAGWVCTAFAVRWSAVAAVFLALAVSASGGVSVLASACLAPYAVFISVYGGLARKAWISFALLAGQALIASGFFVRLRRRGAGAKEPQEEASGEP